VGQPRDKFLSRREVRAGMAPLATGLPSGETGGWSDPAAHKASFVMSNGTRLYFLDWGGPGPALILIHGYASNPHVFDDFAPAFTGRFRVVAYARRGHGQSDAKGPYDTATLTNDLRGLMDGLRIAKAHLAGWSMGAVEITSMAGIYPERVNRIVYLDGAYDWWSPAWEAASKALPRDFWIPPAQAKASLEAYREYRRVVWTPAVTDRTRVEANLRDGIVIQADGTLRRRMTEEAVQAVSSTSHLLDYAKVRAPALAIYASTFRDVTNGDPAQKAEQLAWEQKYMVPFQAASIERVQRELPHVEIMKVPGTHLDFVFTCREQVVAAMRRFLRGR
jgi:pimeloyl-ACP methyl ester carboxylesterase